MRGSGSMQQRPPVLSWTEPGGVYFAVCVVKDLNLSSQDETETPSIPALPG